MTHPRFWTIEEMAAHLGVRETAIRKRLLVASHERAASGEWPWGLVPEPEPGGWVKWDSHRPDVLSWVEWAVCERDGQKEWKPGERRRATVLVGESRVA